MLLSAKHLLLRKACGRGCVVNKTPPPPASGGGVYHFVSGSGKMNRIRRRTEFSRAAHTALPESDACVHHRMWRTQREGVA
jgi:hypothetical protein